MGEMKRIIVDDVPVEQLPEVLRQRIVDGPTEVRITVEFEAGVHDASPSRSLRSFVGAGRGLFDSPEQATGYIRALRDEWDD